MVNIRSIFLPFRAALLGAALLAAPSVAQTDQSDPAGSASAARPTQISNIAHAEWDVGSSRLRQSSNQVDIVLAQDEQVVTLYQFSRQPGSLQLNVPPNACMGNNGRQAVELRGVWAGQPTQPASLALATKIRAGEPLVVVLSRPTQNTNPNLVESVEHVITIPSGDRETIELIEDGPNSGLFVGMINTASIPPTPQPGDCVLSVNPGEMVNVEVDNPNGTLLGDADVEILIDPFGETFDSADGTPISGSRVTLIDLATGQPAQVFGDDGVSDYPNSVITGSTVTDASGRVYNFGPGFYRFPFARAGRYSLIVEPPAPYSFPSNVPPQDLTHLRRSDGLPFTIVDGSYGGVIVLDDPAPVRVDVPIDRPGGALTLTKAANATTAVAGDAVQYRITVANADPVRTTGAITIEDLLPPTMRLRSDTVRVDGVKTTPTVAPNGRAFSVAVPPLAPGESSLLTYLAEIRQDAAAGDAINSATASDDRGATSPKADAVVRIERDGISERFTIIGRITDGGCAIDQRKAGGIAGVRVMMEDGSYTVTDADGQYHFEGVKSGLHVVQVDPSTFPLDRAPVDCARNTRSAGSAISRFVQGRGGALMRADFRAQASAPRAAPVTAENPRPDVATNPEAAGAERDWFAGQAPGIAWLFPEADHNPRAKAIRVAIKHKPGQKVELMVNGKAVNPLSFDGTKKSGDGRMAVSLWRGLEIQNRQNQLKARVINADGSIAAELERPVYFANSPLRAELLRDRSVLVADGITRPVIAVRLTDRNGRPVHHDLVGDYQVPAPYTPAVEVDAQQANQLSGLERAAPVWRVSGDDGVAYIELAPTTASGSLNITFPFRDGEVKREQRIETWLEPGNRPWTVVGFAASTLGFNTLDERLEKLAEDEDDIQVDGRIALYAKGRVTGKWLMTLAYDSDKKEDETRFQGVIDPRRYYTIYADRSEQRYDAASVRRLYLKLERPQFYALFGDYVTGIDEPELARHQRAFNGVKAEYRNENIHITAFGSDTPNRFRREEIQGNGLSGPYALGARDILANSERITLQVRDRLRSDRIVEERELTRHIDYDIDYLSGSLRFREPILSRDSQLNPQFIIAEYETLGVAGRDLNAGGRASYQTDDGKLKLGATAIHDENDVGKTDLIGADVRFRPDQNTEIRAEVAVSDKEAKAGAVAPQQGSATAWLVEAEHHSARFDILAYYRRQGIGFGVGQLNGAESGTRKFGVDSRLRVAKELAIAATAYQENFLETGARRRVANADLEYRGENTSVRAGILHASDNLSDGTTNRSTLAKFGVTQQMLDDRLEIDAQTEFALGGQDESIDFPALHKLTARFALTDSIKLIGSYEIADGENIDARTARVGLEIAPWEGARILATTNSQNISELGSRTFAAFGLTQSLRLSDKWSVDFTLDSNLTVSGLPVTDIVNPLQPVAAGGFLGSGNLVTEDFTALTLGATYRDDDWSWVSRAEWRDGDLSKRYGFTSAVLKQLGDGNVLGGLVSWFRAEGETGATTELIEAELSWAHRPIDSRWSVLNKLEYREDRARNAVAGLLGPVGGAAFLIDGDATSRRLINSVSINYTPLDLHDGLYLENGEYSLFWGTRYVFDKFGQDDLKGWSNIVGADAKFDLSDTIDVGAQATARIGNDFDSVAYSGGPAVTLSPFKNANITVGYNVVGYHDRDFEEAIYTRDGPFVTLKVKFDQTTFAGLGL